MRSMASAKLPKAGAESPNGGQGQNDLPMFLRLLKSTNEKSPKLLIELKSIQTKGARAITPTRIRTIYNSGLARLRVLTVTRGGVGAGVARFMGAGPSSSPFGCHTTVERP